ncbi:MAG: hypothetical protein WCJ09_13440 [Planctomycetota bacterium]
MKLTVRTSADQFRQYPQRHKQPRAGRVSQFFRPPPQFLSRPLARGSQGISSNRRSNRTSACVDDLHPQWLWRVRYGQGEFDEREHPRAPAGRSDGGQFVPKNGGGNGGPPSREFVVPKRLGAYEKVLRANYDNIPNLTTAELQSDLHDRTRELVLATTTEDREYAELWIHRLNQELQQRDFSDEKASLAVKKRIWEAQRKYTLLQQQYRQLNTWLEQSRHTIWKSSESVRAVREKLAAVKQSMVTLARVTGAKLPHDNPSRNWTFEQKLAAVADRILKSGKLAPEIAKQLEAAVRPENLARMGAMIALLAAAHAFPPAGFAADLTLLAFGGTESALIAHRLYLEVSSVQDELDLNSAARVLEEELASNAAGQLIQHLTGATIKGAAKLPKAAAKFNENYTITIDRKKLRDIATGVKQLTPKPGDLVPFTVQKKRPARPVEKQRDLPKLPDNSTPPKAVLENQAKHRKLVENQQKELTEAIDNAAKEDRSHVIGTMMNVLGREFQKTSHATLRKLSGTTLKKDRRIGKGEGAEIDHVVWYGKIRVYVESKYSIRTIRRRMVKQLTNAFKKAKPGDGIILNVARKPTQKEKMALKKALTPAVYRRIKIRYSQTSMYKTVYAMLKGKKHEKSSQKRGA